MRWPPTPRLGRSCGRSAPPSCRALAGPAGRSGGWRSDGLVSRLGDAPTIDGPALADALEQIVQAMRGLGKAEAGDKTMLDALAPAAEALRARVEAGDGLAEALTAACEAAEAGREATIPLQARKGGRRTWASAASATRIPARPRRR